MEKRNGKWKMENLRRLSSVLIEFLGVLIFAQVLINSFLEFSIFNF